MTTKISSPNWTTKEGEKIAIEQMASPHLLSTIHMIERNRLNNLMSILNRENLIDETVSYYYRFPKEYEALCDEAERRHLILRGVQKPTTALTKSKKEKSK